MFDGVIILKAHMVSNQVEDAEFFNKKNRH